jgi:DNA-binding NarL/FixJ family response regulator
MEPTEHTPDPERLGALARAHYRAARWDDALAAVVQLQALGHSSSELDDLANDIRLKQRLETVQVPDFGRPRRGRGPLLAVLGAAGGLALLAALALAVAPLLGGPADRPEAVALSRNIAAVLPTAAPEPAAPAAAPAPAAEASGSLAVAAAPGAALEPGVRNVYIILDASGSMLARSGGSRKIDLAQEALGGLVRALPDDAGVALRTYGRRRADDCGDVELLAEPGPLYREGLIAQIEAIEPVNLSRTPIAASLEAAAADLEAARGETVVLLVSDGEESCDGDPVAAAAALHAARPDVRVSVVGFDIAPELRERLAQIAVAGGGSYADAGDLGELEAALNRAAAPGFRVIDAGGAEVGAGSLGAALELPAGAYTLVVGAEPAPLEQPVEVRGGMATVVTIGAEGGRLQADVRRDWAP